MTREELEHAIRAACDLADDTEVIVFGSQAILGQFPDAPTALRQSAEADIAPKHAVDKVDLIDAVLGENSQFHQTHGFYVHGVPIQAATLPAGWEERAVKVQNRNTREFIGWCLEAHDLAASKLVAFREKDLEFVRVLLVEKMVVPRGSQYLSIRYTERLAAAGIDASVGSHGDGYDNAMAESVIGPLQDRSDPPGRTVAEPG
ncbi:MAG: hypothetical protein JWM95_1339 [Gemmatimonadetes bacterium]|nr:hypothetical protein [Gemmatimonadota bacterium]